jgi:hypothetical protein
MAELVRDIFYRNIESAGVRTSGKNSIVRLRILRFCFTADSFCFAVPVFGEMDCETNGILAQKNSPRPCLCNKNFSRSALPNADFQALSSVEKLTAAQTVQPRNAHVAPAAPGCPAEQS